MPGHHPTSGLRPLRIPQRDPTSISGARGMYRLHAPIYDLTRWAFLRGRREAVRWLELRAGMNALEVGCGTGSNLVRMSRLVGDEGQVHGIDLSPHMLARARRKLERSGSRNVVLHETDAGSYELDRRFDAILYAYSLSMIPDWRRSLDSAARHLQPRGRLVVVDFGSFRGLGPLRKPLRAWLRWHHVDPERPLAETLGGLFPDAVTVIQRGAGDWRMLARCIRTDC